MDFVYLFDENDCLKVDINMWLEGVFNVFVVGDIINIKVSKVFYVNL